MIDIARLDTNMCAFACVSLVHCDNRKGQNVPKRTHAELDKYKYNHWVIQKCSTSYKYVILKRLR